MSEMEYPVILALEDFVPVVFTAAGALLLARVDGIDTRLARIAALLVGLGGVAKAGWKTVIATTDVDLWMVPLALFPFLSAGFLVLIKAVEPRVPVPAIAGLWMAGLGTAFAIGGTLPMLILTIAASTAAAVILSRRHKLFIVWIIGQYALGPLSSGEQTIARQWLEQSINTVSQAMFLIAAWRLVALQRQQTEQEIPS
ncbi:hypothetical protein ABGB12_13760 [Actinocorallia sp. B10E7]|uniref:hypothetical protein n=1 Tax=Actinocorallia sp. B10E7 TaxID=3153558 RepID=UPI00325C99BA